MTRHTTLRRKVRIKPRRSKPRRGRVLDSAYKGWIATLPCTVCRAWPVEVCHVGLRGFGQKCSDRETIPLCPAHHREGREAQHVMGRRFWGHFGIDRDAVIAALNAAYEVQA